MSSLRRLTSAVLFQKNFRNVLLPLHNSISSSTHLSRTAKQLPEEEKHLMQEEKDCLMDFDHEMLAARGYLRNQKSYSPPHNVAELVQTACVEAGGSERPDFEQKEVKFAVLARCAKDFKYTVPNSILHTIESADLLLQFYSTPIDVRVPLDRMKDINLPKNLHVIYNYKRFNPETDTKFKGVSAFPGESNLVTGLKAKKKYKGFTNEPEWLRYNLKVETNKDGVTPKKKFTSNLIVGNDW